MDNLLEAALNEKERLAKEKEAIDIRLGELDVFIRMHAALSKKVMEPMVSSAQGVTSTLAISSAQPVAARAKDVLVIAKNIVAGGTWATSEEIADAVKKRGYVITASNPIARVSQILSGSGMFDTQRGKGWTIKAGSNASGVAH